jgi:hypothetical protein
MTAAMMVARRARMLHRLVRDQTLPIIMARVPCPIDSRKPGRGFLEVRGSKVEGFTESSRIDRSLTSPQPF